MNGTVNQYLSALASEMDRKAIGPVVTAGANLDSSQMLTSAGLAITAAAATTVSAVTSSYAVANGTLVNIPGATVLPALSGTVSNGTYNVFCFYTDSSGNLTSAMGNAGSTLGGIGFPQLPQKQVMIGFVIIHPTGTGNFVGGTTHLDDATVIPNAIYINAVGGFDASVLIG